MDNVCRLTEIGLLRTILHFWVDELTYCKILLSEDTHFSSSDNQKGECVMRI